MDISLKQKLHLPKQKMQNTLLLHSSCPISLAIRCLTDSLEDAVYLNSYYLDQKQVHAKLQFTLLKDMEKQNSLLQEAIEITTAKKS
jgi:hypothetical protein